MPARRAAHRAPPPRAAADPVGPVEWLLDPAQPAVRYRALRELLGRPEGDPEVREARARIPNAGWVAGLLGECDPGGWWGAKESFYRPKYVSTHWKMLVLADLGASAATPAVRRSCELWMDGFPLRGGGVGGITSTGTGHLCVVGNMARALIRMGYVDDPRVARSMEWLAAAANPLGGWSCFGRGRNLDSWEALAAFAAYPRDRWNSAMARAVERGVEFYLERELHRQGARYDPWYRYHYPVHYYYDLLVGLDLVTSLGTTTDPRLGFALDHLRSRRRADGRWNLDAVHPDVDGAMARWFRDHPQQRPVPFALEAPDAPSRMITLRALGVLRRVEGPAAWRAAGAGT